MTALLPEVGDLAILEVKFVHEGLAIEEVIEGFISNLKKPGSQTEKASLQKRRNPACTMNVDHRKFSVC